ncbi:MAG TPA: zinc-dependent metalloprotease [Actinomycetota bacterium]|nr:zinc-dependent metalloprotease [Actinomycetota bacterium]
MSSGLVDEAIASRFAAKFAQPGSLDQSYLLDGLQESFEELTREAEPLIAEESGFISPHPAVPRVLSRQEWATANVTSMLELMSPLLVKMQKRMDDTPAFPGAKYAYKAALGAQLGTVLGFLSQRVLGQYDILVGHQNQVWFVGPNIVMMERRFGFLPRDFRLWIVLHELTHRSQFEANPWVRPHFLGLVNEMLDSMDMDAKALADRMMSSFKPGHGPKNSEENAPLVFRVLQPDQLEIFNRLQAFMSVIEGHGNFVMDRVGEGRIPSQPRMSQALRGGGTIGSPLARLMAKVLGFELKKAQYVQGQLFFDAVYANAGSGGVKAVFHSVEALPTLEEVKSPERWLSRVAP